MLNGLSEHVNSMVALAPAADRYDSDPATDIYKLAEYGSIEFELIEGAGGTGTVKIEVMSCDDVAGNNPVAIPFKYRIKDSSSDSWGDWTWAEAAGYTTVAGANKQVVIDVHAQELQAEGNPCVYLQLTEVVDDPCVAGVMARLYNPAYAGQSLPPAIT